MGNGTVALFGNQGTVVASGTISFDIVGDAVQVTISVTVEVMSPVPGTYYFDCLIGRSSGSSEALAVQDIYAVLQHEETYSTSVEDLTSQGLHGIRRRMSPLVASQFVADLTNFTPDLTFLETQAQAELDRFKNPQEVYIVDTTAATTAERDSLLAAAAIG